MKRCLRISVIRGKHCVSNLAQAGIEHISLIRSHIPDTVELFVNHIEIGKPLYLISFHCNIDGSLELWFMKEGIESMIRLRIDKRVPRKLMALLVNGRTYNQLSKNQQLMLFVRQPKDSEMQNVGRIIAST